MIGVLTAVTFVGLGFVIYGLERIHAVMHAASDLNAEKLDRANQHLAAIEDYMRRAARAPDRHV